MKLSHTATQRGVALITALSILAVLTAMTVTFMIIANLELKSAVAVSNFARAKLLAEGAFNAVVSQLHQDKRLDPGKTNLFQLHRARFNALAIPDRNSGLRKRTTRGGNTALPGARPDGVDNDQDGVPGAPCSLDPLCDEDGENQFLAFDINGNGFIEPDEVLGVDIDEDGELDAIWIAVLSTGNGMDDSIPPNNCTEDPWCIGADGIDNDLDGVIDEIDEGMDELGEGEQLFFTISGDRIDNDGDNPILSTNGIDDDGDGNVDEVGEGIDEPFEEQPGSGDGLDNDGDGLIDEIGEVEPVLTEAGQPIFKPITIVGRYAVLVKDEASKINLNHVGGTRGAVLSDPLGTLLGSTFDEDLDGDGNPGGIRGVYHDLQVRLGAEGQNQGAGPHELNAEKLYDAIPGFGDVLAPEFQRQMTLLRWGSQGEVLPGSLNLLATDVSSGAQALDPVDSSFLAPGLYGFDDNRNNFFLERDGIDNDADGFVDEPFEGVDEPAEFRFFRPRGGDNATLTIDQAKLVSGIGQGLFDRLENMLTVYAFDKNTFEYHPVAMPPDNDVNGIPTATPTELSRRLMKMSLNHDPPRKLMEKMRTGNVADAAQLAVNIRDARDQDLARSELIDPETGDLFGGVEAIRINEIMVRPVLRVEAEVDPFLVGVFEAPNPSPNGPAWVSVGAAPPGTNRHLTGQFAPNPLPPPAPENLRANTWVFASSGIGGPFLVDPGPRDGIDNDGDTVIDELGEAFPVGLVLDDETELGIAVANASALVPAGLYYLNINFSNGNIARQPQTFLAGTDFSIGINPDAVIPLLERNVEYRISVQDTVVPTLAISGQFESNDFIDSTFGTVNLGGIVPIVVPQTGYVAITLRPSQDAFVQLDGLGNGVDDDLDGFIDEIGEPEALLNFFEFSRQPDSEWVELVNVGSKPVNLAGFQLEMGNLTGGIPSADPFGIAPILFPGRHAVVVMDRFPQDPAPGDNEASSIFRNGIAFEEDRPCFGCALVGAGDDDFFGTIPPDTLIIEADFSVVAAAIPGLALGVLTATSTRISQGVLIDNPEIPVNPDKPFPPATSPQPTGGAYRLQILTGLGQPPPQLQLGGLAVPAPNWFEAETHVGALENGVISGGNTLNDDGDLLFDELGEKQNGNDTFLLLEVLDVGTVIDGDLPIAGETFDIRDIYRLSVGADVDVALNLYTGLIQSPLKVALTVFADADDITPGLQNPIVLASTVTSGPLGPPSTFAEKKQYSSKHVNQEAFLRFTTLTAETFILIQDMRVPGAGVHAGHLTPAVVRLKDLRGMVVDEVAYTVADVMDRDGSLSLSFVGDVDFDFIVAETNNLDDNFDAENFNLVPDEFDDDRDSVVRLLPTGTGTALPVRGRSIDGLDNDLDGIVDEVNGALGVVSADPISKQNATPISQVDFNRAVTDPAFLEGLERNIALEGKNEADEYRKVSLRDPFKKPLGIDLGPVVDGDFVHLPGIEGASEPDQGRLGYFEPDAQFYASLVRKHPFDPGYRGFPHSGAYMDWDLSVPYTLHAPFRLTIPPVPAPIIPGTPGAPNHTLALALAPLEEFEAGVPVRQLRVKNGPFANIGEVLDVPFYKIDRKYGIRFQRAIPEMRLPGGDPVVLRNGSEDRLFKSVPLTRVVGDLNVYLPDVEESLNIINFLDGPFFVDFYDSIGFFPPAFDLGIPSFLTALPLRTGDVDPLGGGFIDSDGDRYTDNVEGPDGDRANRRLVEALLGAAETRALTLTVGQVRNEQVQTGGFPDFSDLNIDLDPDNPDWIPLAVPPIRVFETGEFIIGDAVNLQAREPIPESIPTAAVFIAEEKFVLGAAGPSAYFVWDADDGVENGLYNMYVYGVQSFPIPQLDGTTIDGSSGFQVTGVPEAFPLDIEVFTGGDLLGSVPTPRGFPDERIASVRGGIPEPDGAIDVGLVEIRNNTVAIRVVNRAQVSTGTFSNFISRIVLTPPQETYGKMNINTAYANPDRIRRTTVGESQNVQAEVNVLRTLPWPVTSRVAWSPGEAPILQVNPEQAAEDLKRDLANSIVDLRPEQEIELDLFDTFGDTNADGLLGAGYTSVGQLVTGTVTFRSVSGSNRQFPLLTDSEQVGLEFPNDPTFHELNRRMIERFKPISNLVTVQSDLFEITVLSQSGKMDVVPEEDFAFVDTNADGQPDTRVLVWGNFEVTGESKIRAVYER